MTSSWNVIAHRGRLDGEQNGIPGNTLASFEALLSLYPNMSIELDVRLTKSGLLLVAHDNLLQGRTNGNGFLNGVKLEDLSNLVVKTDAGFTDKRIPQLEEVFEVFDGRSIMQLELKYGPNDPPGLLEKVLDLINKYPDQKVTLSSFNHEELILTPPHIPVGVLTNAMPYPNVRSYLMQFSANGERPLDQIAFHPDIWTLTTQALSDAHSAGITVNAYTVPKDMFEWCYANNVNVITDFPLAALEFLEQAG